MTYAPAKTTGISGSGKVTLPAYSMLVLALIGLGAAVYVAQGNYTGQPLWCPVIDGCNAVVNSPYSRVFGVPMSYFGFIYYLYMFGLAARLAFEPFSNSLRFRAILYAAMGAASSMYFMYLQLAFIREVCSYCLIATVTSLLLLFAALWHFQATRHPAIKKLTDLVFGEAVERDARVAHERSCCAPQADTQPAPQTASTSCTA
jgi:uncharacterized membrane protein